MFIPQDCLGYGPCICKTGAIFTKEGLTCPQINNQELRKTCLVMIACSPRPSNLFRLIGHNVFLISSQGGSTSKADYFVLWSKCSSCPGSVPSRWSYIVKNNPLIFYDTYNIQLSSRKPEQGQGIQRSRGIQKVDSVVYQSRGHTRRFNRRPHRWRRC